MQSPAASRKPIDKMIFTGSACGEMCGKFSLTDNLDFYRAAKLIIDQFGDGAADHATKMSKEMAAKDDITGYTMWELVRNAIVELQARATAKNSTVH
jgi:hypothetical protein